MSGLKRLKEAVAERLWYIGRRDNPQFPKPYYVAYGQLSKEEAGRKEGSLYGSMRLEPYDSKEAYEAAIAKLLAAGFRVNRMEQ